MKVFISWSGAISHKVAIVLRDWLPDVIQLLEPYVSSEDIDKGARWSTDISEELENSSFGILCVTKDNLNAPWLNFEAGALSSSAKKGRVAPLLFGVELSEITKSPLSQFQVSMFDKDDVKKLLGSLNTAGDTLLLDKDRLNATFGRLWSDLENRLNEIKVLEPEAKEGGPSSQGEHAAASSQAVQQPVGSTEEFSQFHSLSIDDAVASVKQYLSESPPRIRLEDLVNSTVGQIVEITSGEDFDMGSPMTGQTVVDRVTAYEAACSTLLAMAPIGGRWAEKEHVLVWEQALQRLGSRDVVEFNKSLNLGWIELQQYPTVLLLYALGIGAVQAGRFQFLERMLATELSPRRQQEAFAARELAPWLSHHFYWGDSMRQHLGHPNERIHNTLRPYAERIALDGDQYALVFNRLEILTGLNIAYHEGTVDPQHNYWRWIALAYSHLGFRRRIMQEIEDSLATMGDSSPFVTCDLFGKTAEGCQQRVSDLKRVMPGRS